jgi:hypothetical protein
LFVVELSTRRVYLMGATTSTTGQRVTPQARNLLMDLADRRCTVKFLVRDQDAKVSRGPVGKIYSSTRPGGAGSAALVGPRLAVTAAQCLPTGSPWWIRFVPASFDGTSLHGSGVESFVSDTRAFAPGGVTGYDWALLRLYEPLGSWLGFFGFNGYDDDWENRPYWTVLAIPTPSAASAHRSRTAYTSSTTTRIPTAGRGWRPGPTWVQATPVGRFSARGTETRGSSVSRPTRSSTGRSAAESGATSWREARAWKPHQLGSDQLAVAAGR